MRSLAKLIKTPFFASVFRLSSASAGGQVFLVAITPILTRLYSKNDFGLLAVFLSMVAIINSFSSFCYELAIPHAKNDREASDLFRLSILILAVTTVVSMPLVGIIPSNQMSLILNKHAFFPFVLAIAIFASGIYSLFVQYATRQRKFKQISNSKIIQSLLLGLLQLVFFKLGPMALIIGFVCSQLAAIVGLLNVAPKNFFDRKIDVLDTMKRYRHYPLMVSPQIVLNTIFNSILPLVIAPVYGTASAGVYLIANRLIYSPINVVVQSIASVYSGHAKDYDNIERLPAYTQKIHALLSIIVCILLPYVSALCLIYIPGLLGEGWGITAKISAVLCISSFAEILASPYSVFLVKNKQLLGLKVQIMLTLFKAVGLILGSMSSTLVVFALIYATFSMLGYATVWTVKFKSLAIDLTSQALLSIGCLAVGILFSLTMLLTYIYSGIGLTTVCISVITGFGLMASILERLKRFNLINFSH